MRTRAHVSSSFTHSLALRLRLKRSKLIIFFGLIISIYSEWIYLASALLLIAAALSPVQTIIVTWAIRITNDYFAFLHATRLILPCAQLFFRLAFCFCFRFDVFLLLCCCCISFVYSFEIWFWLRGFFAPNYLSVLLAYVFLILIERHMKTIEINLYL